MLLKFIALLAYSGLFPLISYCQSYGCTDHRALNYNPLATLNDGSCVYEKTNFEAVEVIGNLPVVLVENSGMIIMNDLIWFINDSGSLPEIYGYDSTTNAIKQIVSLKYAGNTDWEAITDDSAFVYIGDFGNNEGIRKNLTIYRISKNNFPLNGNASVSYDSITFVYPDQNDFKPANQNNDFDCEAMLVVNDSVFLFNKCWKTEKTKLYAIPAVPGHYSASLLDSFSVNRLVTDVAIDHSSKNVFLLGYKNFQPFYWILFDYYDNRFFSGNKRRFDMPSHIFFQTESAYFKNNKTVYFSSEKTPVSANRLFRAEIYPYVFKNSSAIEESKNDIVKLYPNPVKNEIIVQFSYLPVSTVEFRIYDSMGKQIQLIQDVKISANNSTKLKINQLKKANYVLLIIEGDQKVFNLNFSVIDD